jgi:lipopolysaccharide export system protein LptA
MMGIAAALLMAGLLTPAAADPTSAMKPPATPAAPAAASTAGSPASASATGGDAFKDRLTALPSATDLRPKGPVDITADRTDAVEGSTAIYSGHVNLVSDTLHMDGDRLELKQHADHAFEARITGAPAHMSHAGTGPDNPPMAAHAKTLVYDSSTGIVDLITEAFVDRNGDTTTADTIHYNLLDRSLQANGGKEQVHIVIQPPPDAPGATPAPAAPATSAPAVPSNSGSPVTIPAPAAGGSTAPPTDNSSGSSKKSISSTTSKPTRR